MGPGFPAGSRTVPGSVQLLQSTWTVSLSGQGIDPY